jgi:hypothetical protein
MALVLTPDQQAIVQQEQLSEAALPDYYSASQQDYLPISRDFEAFLILSDNTLKTSALQWIQTSVQINKGHQLRDALTQLALTQELSNAQAQITEYTKQLQGFDAFRQNFQTSQQFASIPEIQLFLNDLQAVIEELSVGNDRAFFDQTVTQVLQRYEDGVGISDAQVQELQSWTSVISTYLSG